MKRVTLSENSIHEKEGLVKTIDQYFIDRPVSITAKTDLGEQSSTVSDALYKKLRRGRILDFSKDKIELSDAQQDNLYCNIGTFQSYLYNPKYGEIEIRFKNNSSITIKLMG